MLSAGGEMVGYEVSLYMPEMDEAGVLKIKVTTEASEVDAIIFESRDNGITWEVSQS